MKNTYTNSNNDCNTSNGRDVAVLRLYKYLSVAVFFQIGITKGLAWNLNPRFTIACN
ncbi:MAG: hypothetical protein HC785_04330 [Calothrix sp. CSU_2_0]|nr:hypothetical protein [Calothrix sp. CSU_2_0]